MRLSISKRVLLLVLLSVCQRFFALDLRPDNVTLQSGGGMGTVSVGTGWQYGKQHWETEVFLGIISRYDSKSSRATIALKENYVPWQMNLNRRLTLEPLTSSLYFTTVISRQFWTRQPARYPSRYYILPTRIRTNIAIGQRIGFIMPESSPVRHISAYYEIGTCDIYALSAAGNSEIGLADRLQLCVGVKVTFRK